MLLFDHAALPTSTAVVTMAALTVPARRNPGMIVRAHFFFPPSLRSMYARSAGAR